MGGFEWVTETYQVLLKPLPDGRWQWIVNGSTGVVDDLPQAKHDAVEALAAKLSSRAD